MQHGETTIIILEDKYDIFIILIRRLLSHIISAFLRHNKALISILQV